MIYSPLPGEYIASAARRGKELLGLKLNKTDYQIKTILENRMQKVILPFSFVEHGVTEEVLIENTLYPLAKALGSIKVGTNYTPTKNWKICLQCVAEDIEAYGIPYIHRRNLLPAVSHCSIHATMLHAKCPYCLKWVTSHTLSDFKKCRRFFSLTPPSFGSPPHAFAIFVSNLLSYNGEPFSSKAFESRIFEELATKLYNRDYSFAFYNIIRDANKALGTNISSATLNGLVLNTSAMLAFFAYQTSEAYLDAMINVVKRSPYGS